MELKKQLIMKKNLLNWMTIVMVAIVSVSFVSCGDDEDETNEISIVGTWRSNWSDEYGSGYTIITFNADGTGNIIEYEQEKGYPGNTTNNRFKYAFDAKTMTIVLMFWDDDEKAYSDYEKPGYISSLTSTTMIVNGHTYIRQ